MSATVTVRNGIYLVPGVQLKERVLVPKWLGRVILWVFFHRTDSTNQITITGLKL